MKLLYVYRLSEYYMTSSFADITTFADILLTYSSYWIFNSTITYSIIYLKEITQLNPDHL